MSASRWGVPVQTAYVVRDVREAAVRFAETTGAGPFLLRRNVVSEAVGPNGGAGVFDHTSAHGQWGRMQIELVQVHTAAPEPFAQTVRAVGRVHHVAIFVNDVGAARARFAETGWPTVLSATTANGNEFAFVDARADLGHLVEIYEPRPSILALYARVADAAREWDGSDPVRPM